MTQDEVSGSVSSSEVDRTSGGSAGSATVSDVIGGDLSAQQDTVRQRRGEGGCAEGGCASERRGAATKGARRSGRDPARGARGLGAAGGPGRPGGVAGGPGDLAGAGAGAGAARPDGHERVRLLPRCGAADGRGSGGHASKRAAGAAVRRCASVQLRSVRRPGPLGRLRRQRLRRDQPRARSSGTSSAWPRRSCWPRGTTGWPRRPARPRPRRRAASYRESMASFAEKGELEIWYDRIDVSGWSRRSGSCPATRASAGPRRRRRQEATLAGGGGEGAAAGCLVGDREDHRGGGRSAPVPRPAAAAGAPGRHRRRSPR